MHKINVIGTSGSGKTTFSRQLAAILGYPYLEMDLIYWKPQWQEPSDDEFFAALRHKLVQPTWVLDGNYNRTAATKWKDVDTIIWIDYSFSRTLYQAITRAIKRTLSGKELWPETGNKESFRKSFMSSDSIILWTIKTYSKNRDRYLAIMNDKRYQHINFIQIRSPSEAHQFLERYSNK